METTKPRGRPRKLRQEEPQKNSNGFEDQSQVEKIVTERQVETDSGEKGIVSLEAFDLKKLDKYVPYKGREELPAPKLGYRKRDKAPYVISNGAPRFFFNGNELIAKYRGLGVKTRLAWRYQGKKPLHRQIRNRLRTMGIPGA